MFTKGTDRTSSPVAAWQQDRFKNLIVPNNRVANDAILTRRDDDHGRRLENNRVMVQDGEGLGTNFHKGH